MKEQKSFKQPMKKLWIFLLGIISFSGFAQSEYDTIVVRDIESWTSGSFQYKLNKKWSFKLSPQLRLQENSSQMERLLVDTDIEYNLNKHFEFGFGYRFNSKYKKSGIQNGQRWNLDATYKFDFNRFDAGIRLRYQSGRDFAPEDPSWENHFRLKTKLEYNIKHWKLDPEITGEIFRLSGKNVDGQFDKMRFTIGSSYKFSKQHSVSIFYGYQQELNTTYPKTTYLVGLGYKYTLKPSKKDEK